MKKYLLGIILTALLTIPAVYGDEVQDSSAVDPQDVIFQTTLTNITNYLHDPAEEYSDAKYFKEVDPNHMPFFKQMRLRVSNSVLYAQTRPKKEKSGNNKLKFWNKKSAPAEDSEQEDNEVTQKDNSELSNTINKVVTAPDETISLEGGVNKEQTEKQLMLDSDNITFNDETGDMIATGRPVLYIPPQNTKVTADTMIYNEGGNILKAVGNVIVDRDGIPMETDELEINMNEETLYVNRVKLNSPDVIVEAQDATQQDGLLVLNNGNMRSDNSYIYRLFSTMGGPDFIGMMVDPEKQANLFGDPDKSQLGIHAKYIEVDAGKNHDIIKAKKIEFSHNDKVFFKWPSLKAYTDKEHSYFESNIPEFGSRRKLGAFVGPGIAFSGPFGSVIKAVPFVNYRDSRWGIGGLLRYVNKYNRTELGYGTAKDVFFLRGKQKLDDNFFLQYAYNMYVDEWFLGGRMPKYMAELYFDKSYPHKDFLGEGRDMTFRQRVGFGFMKDDDKSYKGERYNDATNMSTTRTRYMAEINQVLFSYINQPKRINFSAGALLQGSAALYGTGDTQFIARFAPYIRTQYKNWMQDVRYFLTGYDDNSPLPHYDSYRYGRSSIQITEAIRLNKYISGGWMGYINLTDDSPNKRLFQENAFFVALGPDDFKLMFGYDFYRDRTYFGLYVAFDPKGTNVTYEKMVIKNPERLGHNDNKKEVEIAFITPPKEDINKIQESRFFKSAGGPEKRVLEYATVIELEDPDKETIE